jgi:group I intron endonuclease
MDTCGIYSITNKKTGQKYIGQSIHIERRFEQHKYNKKPVTYIDRAIKKHGADNFEFEILEECKPKELNKLEKKYIQKHNTYKNNNHYNLTTGGDSKYITSKTTKLKRKETIKRKKAHSYVEQAQVDAEIYKDLTGEKPKDVHIESFFEDGIYFGHQRVWKDENDVWDY